MRKLLLLIFFCSHTLLAQSPTFIKIKGGTFTMGNDDSSRDNPSRKDEKPAHEVKITEFSMSETPITVAEYKAYCGSTGIKMPEAPSWGWINNHPIVKVKWSDDRNYCSWLQTILKKKVMLPTEAQWEYAAQAGGKGKKYKHSGGKKIILTLVGTIKTPTALRNLYAKRFQTL